MEDAIAKKKEQQRLKQEEDAAEVGCDPTMPLTITGPTDCGGAAEAEASL